MDAVPRPDAPLYRRMAPRIPELARLMVARLHDEVPFYNALPRELLDGEITDTAGNHLRVFYRSLREGRRPTEAELTELAASATRRAQERFPLEAMVAALHVSARVGWSALIEMAKPEDAEDLETAGLHILRYLQEVVPVVAGAYLRERQAIHGEEHEAHRALVTALLTGAPPELLAERADVDLAPCYAVIVLHPAHPSSDPSAEPVAARRTTRRLQEELDVHGDGRVLAALDHSGGGTALVPADADTLAAELHRLTGLVARIEAALGVPIHAGISAATEPSAIPAAVDEAREVADLAARLHRQPGAYRLDDVLLEYQMSRPGPGRDRLAGLLDRLDGHPHLLEALRAYIAFGYNRHRAAAELHVHRNTLNYRLRRIATITHLNPADPVGARLLAAALITRDVTAS